MTDQELAQALQFVQALEARTKALLKMEDQAERDQALLVTRLATPLRQKIETWISVRAIRSHLTAPTLASAGKVRS